MKMSRERTRVYVGDLGSGGSKPELEKEFEKYGAVKSVWVARNPPGEVVFFHPPEWTEGEVPIFKSSPVSNREV